LLLFLSLYSWQTNAIKVPSATHQGWGKINIEKKNPLSVGSKHDFLQLYKKNKKE